MSTRLVGLAVVAFLGGCSIVPITNELTTRDGAFTATQAERGRLVYNSFCASCHPAAFYEAQLSIWHSAMLGDFFEALSATMPSENPGALATSQYLDVIAYILSITGSPPGKQELTVDNARGVRIVNE